MFKKMLTAIKRGIKPPPCRGREACDEYCSNPDNMEMCMNFAIEAGFMDEQEKGESQKMLQALKKGLNRRLAEARKNATVTALKTNILKNVLNSPKRLALCLPKKQPWLAKPAAKARATAKAEKNARLL